MTNAAQQLITEIETNALKEKEKYDAMTKLQKAQEIHRIAFKAKARDDIRLDVMDMAYMLIEDIKREQGL